MHSVRSAPSDFELLPIFGEAVPDAGDGHGEEAPPSVDPFAEPS